jgi:hypothetical protein
MQRMEIYKTLKNQHQTDLLAIKKQYNSISILRFVCILFFLILGYYFFKTENTVFAYLSILSMILFLLLIRFHNKISDKKDLKEALISINENEIAFLNREKNTFENGIEFNDFNHTYAYDLDVFGDNSMFQNLNRTFTFIGKKTLANSLLKVKNLNEIIENQQAAKELFDKINFRQDFASLAKVSNDSQKDYQSLLKWSYFNSQSLSKTAVVLSYILPIFLWILIAIYTVTQNPNFFNYISFLFIANLIFAGRFIKRIKLENDYSTNINKIVKQYGLIIEKIENENFISSKLINLQKSLHSNNEKASKSLVNLSELFAKLDAIGNLLMTVLLNGAFLYHLHNLKAIIDWKNNNVKNVNNWLNVIGEFEMLNSIANFSFNNPDFAFPELNNNHEISFENLSHPLLNPKTRIGNNVDFQPQSFMILTGSNCRVKVLS